MKKQKVYTFYESIDKWDSSKLLLDLWVENWSSKGFEPIVLNESDAKSHPYYTEYDKLIRSNYEKITGCSIMKGWGNYIYYCFVRHLAFANKMTDEISLAMDYDIYNLDYENESLKENKITFFAGRNPCCLSGNRHLFLEMCMLMSEFTSKNIDDYKHSFNISKHKTPLHDMGWIKYTLNLEENLSEKLKEIVTFGGQRIQGCESAPKKSIIHVSFGWLKVHYENINKSHSDLDCEEKLNMRYKLAKEQLKK